MKSLYTLSRQDDYDSQKLLFWPNNPRLKIRDMQEVIFTDKELLDKSKQQSIFRKLKETEHQVGELIQKISGRGFDPSHALIVQKIGSTGHYLVLEGNRRLTAIRSIQANKQSSASLKKSLHKIPCFLFECERKNVQESRLQLVFDQQYEKKKEHTRIQRAHILYDVYMARLRNQKRGSTFRKDPDLIKYFVDGNQWKEDEFIGELAVVQLYQQITQAGVIVDHKYRERLTWPYEHQRQFGKYFGYDSEVYQMDDAGLDRYIDLFIGSSAPIHNPKPIFRSFLNIMRYGTASDIQEIRDSGNSDLVFEIESRLKEIKKSDRFVISLRKIQKELQKLNVLDFMETEEEVRLILGIKKLTLERVAKVATEDILLGKEIDPTKPKKEPRIIQEACDLSDDNVAWAIIQVSKRRSSHLVQSKSVTTWLLARWGIVSRGKPRKNFEVIVEGVLDRMVSQDII